MRPRRWAVENCHRLPTAIVADARFNAATAMGRGEPDCPVLTSTLSMALQCGHGDEAVENPRASMPVTLRSDAASMRPRRCGRGERVPDALQGLGRRELQCGHGDWPWRTSPSGCVITMTVRFNAATAMSPWRTCSLGRFDLLVDVLQCGHGDVAVENGERLVLEGSAGPELQCGHGDWPWRTSSARRWWT